MTFQIHALAHEPFQFLFGLSDEDLERQGARRVTADAHPGFPCRVSLEDAQIGDTLMLLNYTHLEVGSPYASKHAIYVRQNVEQAHPLPGEVPASLSSRLLSVRGFDEGGFMKDADVVDGQRLSGKLEDLFCDTAIEFVDIHNAKQGCFAARATRV
jgi:hypothetical protein